MREAIVWLQAERLVVVFNSQLTPALQASVGVCSECQSAYEYAIRIEPGHNDADESCGLTCK